MRKRTRQTKLQRLEDVLQAALKKRKIFLNFEDKSIISLWNRAVGPQISAQSRPGTLKGTTLFVKVSSSVWMQQLHFLKEEIIEKINQFSSEITIKNIYFSIGMIPSAPLQEKEKKPFFRGSHLLKDRDRKIIEESIASLPDQELREILKRVMTKEISRRRFMENQ